MSTKLRLPLETIERILYYAFGADLPPSTPKDRTPSPPPSTSHLLLVSKGFRSISLSFFYRSITISRSHDYFTFFDPEEGLLVNPKDGEDRAKLVKELKVDVGRTSQIPIDLPFVTESFKQGSEPEGIIITLGSPKFSNLENVSFFERQPATEESIGELETRETNAGRLLGGDEDYHYLAMEFTLAEEQRDWDELSEDAKEPGGDAEQERQRQLEDPDPDWLGEMNAKGERRTWEEWKWVEEDGTLSPFDPLKPVE